MYIQVNILGVGVRRSDIQDRIASILAFSAGSGYRSDETDPNSIFRIATIVLLLSPTNTIKFPCTIFQVF